MTRIDYIVVHCTATLEGHNVRLKDIDRWHREDNHWASCGYHYVIGLDGMIEVNEKRVTHPRPLPKGGEAQVVPPLPLGGARGWAPGAHCKALGTNHCSIGVAYVGGCRTDHYGKLYNCDTRTSAQKHSLRLLLQLLQSIFPEAKIVGHHDMDPTRDCPCFNALEEYREICAPLMINE